MRAQPNKTYKDLRQKQKARISDWMFWAICEYYKEHGKMPEGEAAEQITVRIYDKIKSLAIWVPYDEVHRAFCQSCPTMKNESRRSVCQSHSAFWFFASVSLNVIVPLVFFTSWTHRQRSASS